MKKTYFTPCVEINETETFEMMALSLMEDPANNNEVLGRDNDWANIWDEDVED